MDFIPDLLELHYKDKEVPVSIVVYHVCSILKKDVLRSKLKSSFLKYKSMDDLMIKAICWNKSSYSWEFKFRKKSQTTQGLTLLK